MSGISNQTVLSDEEYADTIGCLNRLKVPQIKDIARCLSLPLSGKKQDLIDRVVGYLEQGKRFNDNVRLLAVRTIVLKVRNNDPIPNFTALYDALRTGAYNFVEGISQYSNYKKQPSSSTIQNKSKTESYPYKGHVLYFKESPFYKLKRLVHGSPQIAIPSKVKAVCRYQFILNEEENKLFQLSGEKIRFYLLCGVSNSSTASTSSALLQFPIPIEIHVNGTHIKENVRGIKGKPGTARPANITPFILPDQQLNKIEMAYAGTTETFLLYLYIVEYISCEEIIQTIVQQPHIHKNSTILDIKKEYSNDDGEDDDIIVSTSSISLKCPLTYARMKYPTKSIYCQHIQCFDGLSYLQLQEQVPSWICPVCSNKLDISHLAISDYYCDILENTSHEIENVTINDDGTWEAISEASNNSNTNGSNNTININKDNSLKGNEDSFNESKLSQIKHSPLSRVYSEEARQRTPVAQPEVIEVISIDSDSDDDVDMNEPINSYEPSGLAAEKLTLLDAERARQQSEKHSNETHNLPSISNNTNNLTLNQHSIEDSTNHPSANNENVILPRLTPISTAINGGHIENQNKDSLVSTETTSTLTGTNNVHSEIAALKSTLGQDASRDKFNLNRSNKQNHRNMNKYNLVNDTSLQHSATKNINLLNSRNNSKEDNISPHNNPSSDPNINIPLLAHSFTPQSHDSIRASLHNRQLVGDNKTASRNGDDRMNLERIYGLPSNSTSNRPMEDRTMKANINPIHSTPELISLTRSVPLLDEQSQIQIPSNARSTSAPITFPLSAIQTNARDNNEKYGDLPTLSGTKLRPLKKLPVNVHSQNSGPLPNIHQLESLLKDRNHDNGQPYQIPTQVPNQIASESSSISNMFDPTRENSKHRPPLVTSISMNQNLSHPPPLVFYGRDSLGDIYQSHNTTPRNSNPQTKSVNFKDYQINQAQQSRRLSPATSYDFHTNEIRQLQDPNQDSNNMKEISHIESPNHASNESRGSENGPSYDLTHPSEKASTSSPAEPNSIRYSRSAFDLANEKHPQVENPNKEQGVVGLLGIVLSEDSMHMKQPSALPPPSERSDLTPLKGKIDSMRLGTGSDKKRSLSGSGSSRTWNKKMNPDHVDSRQSEVSNRDSTPSKPVHDALSNQ